MKKPRGKCVLNGKLSFSSCVILTNHCYKINYFTCWPLSHFMLVNMQVYKWFAESPIFAPELAWQHDTCLPLYLVFSPQPPRAVWSAMWHQHPAGPGCALHVHCFLQLHHSKANCFGDRSQYCSPCPGFEEKSKHIVLTQVILKDVFNKICHS